MSLNLESAIRGDAVYLHLTTFTVKLVFTAEKTGNEGKDVESAVAPIGRIALPQILGAVSAEYGMKLRPVFGNGNCQKLVFYGLKHIFSFSRCFRKARRRAL